MVRKCSYRGCHRIVTKEDRVSNNKVFYDYCSLYCFEAMKRGMRPIKRDSGAGGSSISLRPIQNECYVCRKIYILNYKEHRANQRLCSQKCYQAITSRKKAHRDFLLLCILYERGTMTAEEISKTSSTMLKHLSPIGVGLTLKAWKAREVVRKELRGKIFDYSYDSDLLPGEAVVQFCRKSV